MLITCNHKNQIVLLHFFINILYISTINLKNFKITWKEDKSIMNKIKQICSDTQYIK
jgi:hypothetical protein